MPCLGRLGPSQGATEMDGDLKDEKKGRVGGAEELKEGRENCEKLNNAPRRVRNIQKKKYNLTWVGL